jgi:hypothetical protein
MVSHADQQMMRHDMTNLIALHDLSKMKGSEIEHKSPKIISFHARTKKNPVVFFISNFHSNDFMSYFTSIPRLFKNDIHFFFFNNESNKRDFFFRISPWSFVAFMTLKKLSKFMVSIENKYTRGNEGLLNFVDNLNWKEEIGLVELMWHFVLKINKNLLN